MTDFKKISRMKIQETEDITLSDDSYIDPELILTYGSIQIKYFNNFLYICNFVHLSSCIYAVKKIKNCEKYANNEL